MESPSAACAHLARRLGRGELGLGKTIQEILGDLKPEATYFLEEEGERTGVLLVDLKEASEIPAVAEPWFLAFNARVECHPVVLPEDIERAGPAIEQAVARFG